jgi:hypothetical protein
MHARKKGTEPGSLYTQNEAMKDVLARCHKRTDVQVCTLTVMDSETEECVEPGENGAILNAGGGGGPGPPRGEGNGQFASDSRGG